MRQGSIGKSEGFRAAALAVLLGATFVRRTGSEALWQSALISWALGAALYFCCQLLIKSSGKDDLCAAALYASKTLGSAFMIAFSGALTLAAAFIAATFSELTVSSVLSRLPTSYCALLITLAVLICACLGWEAISRTARLLFLLVAITLAAILAGVSGLLDASLLFVQPSEITLSDALLSRRTLLFIAPAALTVVWPSMQDKKTAARAGAGALLAGAAVVLTGLWGDMLLPGQYWQQSIAAPYEMASFITSGNYYQRWEDIMYVVWLASCVITCAFYIYIAANAYCKVFDMKDIRPAAAALSAIMLVFTVCINNRDELEWLLTTTAGLTFAVAAVFCIVASGIAAARRFIDGCKL